MIALVVDSQGRRTRMSSHQPISVLTHLKNRWKLLNIFSALASLGFCYVVAQPQLLDWQIGLATITVGVTWLRFLGFIRSLNINFATYITCLLQILVDITYYLVIQLVVMLMFGSMIFIWNVDDQNAELTWTAPWNSEEAANLVHLQQETNGDNFDMTPFRGGIYESLITMYRLLLGETHRYWFHDGVELSLYVSYELIVVILMLNVLIAVVSDSYEYSIIRGA